MVRAAAGLLDDRTAGQVVVARTAAHEGRDGRRGARRRAGAGGWSAELGGGVTVLLRRSEMSAPVHLVTRFNVPNVLPTVSCPG